MKKAQIAVIVIIVVIVGYLYHLQPVGLVKPAEGHANNGMVAGSKPEAAKVTPEMVSATAKTVIGPNLSVKINSLETQLKKAEGGQKQALERQLAQAWDDVNQPAPAGYYYLDLARSDNKFGDWLNAGDRFNTAFRSTQDSTLQSAMLMNAVEAFKKANELSPDNLDAKTGLGVAYVNGGAPSPMQGISLLLDVVSKDPKNWNANFNLGLFSMKSGQYDKAVERFKTLIAQKADVEPYFYLAESYKQLGMKPEAIAAYKKCKELMPDADFDKRIDDFIKELQN